MAVLEYMHNTQIQLLLLMATVALLYCSLFFDGIGRSRYLVHYPVYLRNEMTSELDEDTPAVEIAHLFDRNHRQLEGITNTTGRLHIDQWRPLVQDILNRFPENFSSKFRNPCWYEGSQLQCVPYFYQLGSYKCGTTDLWDKLVKHHDIIPVAKEPHWWAWRRFGYTKLPIHGPLVLKTRSETGDKDDHRLQWYLNLFRGQSATEQIQKNNKLVFGDASITNLWGLGYYKWEERFLGRPDPPFFLADLLHAVQPRAKITVILRDPVEKLWTTYMLTFLWQQNKKASPRLFESYFQKLAKDATRCEATHSPTYCAFVHGSKVEDMLGNALYQGMYYIYLKEWVEVYGLENIHVMRLEDWKANPIPVLQGLHKYLELDPLPMRRLEKIVRLPPSNVNPKAKKMNMKMLKSTRKLVQDFYRPWNKKLAELLKDPIYTWDY